MDDWQPTDDNCFELIRKALDEMSYQHHDQILDWLEQKVKQARLGAAVEERNKTLEAIKESQKHVSEYLPVLEARLTSYREALEHIREYWNRDENQDAMADALHTILALCDRALETK